MITQNTGGAIIQDFRPITHYYARQYKLAEGNLDLDYGENGEILNEVLWVDPKIAEGTNHNVLTDAGAQAMFGLLFALSGSAVFNFMGFGASSTAAAHTQTTLVYELNADASRSALTNQSGTQMTQGSVVSLNTFTDTSETPNITYYTQALVQGSINGSVTANVNQPVNEIGVFSTAAPPGTPTGTSGTMFSRYVLGGTVTLSPGTLLQIQITYRGA